jgi:hypothetical protein
MAGKYTGLQRTYTIEDSTMELYKGVIYGTAEGSCKKATATGQYPLGVVNNDERLNDPLRAGGDQTGRNVSVMVEGCAEITLGGTVAYGDILVLTAGGLAIKLPTAAGSYFTLGIAEKAGVSGDIIPVTMEVMKIVVA